MPQYRSEENDHHEQSTVYERSTPSRIGCKRKTLGVTLDSHFSFSAHITVIRKDPWPTRPKTVRCRSNVTRPSLPEPDNTYHQSPFTGLVSLHY